MKPICHLGASIITGATVFLTTKTITPSIACFLVGWLADVDHIWDFYKNVGKDFTVKRFLKTFENGEIKKHIYTSTVMNSYLGWYSCVSSPILITFLSFTTLGFAIHLFLDQIFNPVKPLTYFITYRILNSYNADIIFKINPKIVNSHSRTLPTRSG